MSETIAEPLSTEPPIDDHVDGSMWDSIREALRGSRRDYTKGPVGRAIMVLAVPMVLEMIMESVFAVCDVFFVSRLGAAAVATVGLTESWLTLVYAIAMGMAIGAAALVARRPVNAMRRCSAPAVRRCSGSSSPGSAVGDAPGGWGGPPHPTGSTTRASCSAECAIVMVSHQRGFAARRCSDPMRVLWFANAINILLGPCLIFGLGPFPRLGVTGAAIATNIGRGAGVLFALSRMLRPGSRIDIHTRHLRVDFDLIKRILRIAWSAAFQILIGMGSWIALTRLVATFGSSVLAGYTIGYRVIIFGLLPAAGLANAAATMVGQTARRNRSAPAGGDACRHVQHGRVDRGGRAVGDSCAYDRSGVYIAIPRSFRRRRVRCASSRASVLRLGHGDAVVQRAGDTRTPTLLNLFVFWMWRSAALAMCRARPAACTSPWR
jgi:hypothetical protein